MARRRRMRPHGTDLPVRTDRVQMYGDGPAAPE